jgi:hypothetical protein
VPEPAIRMDMPRVEGCRNHKHHHLSKRRTFHVRLAKVPRVKKSTAQSRSVVSRGARSQRFAPTAAKPPTPDRGLNRPKREPDVVEELGHNTTRTPLQPRRSRRLAGQLPKFSKLSDRGEALRYETPLRQLRIQSRRASQVPPRTLSKRQTTINP